MKKTALKFALAAAALVAGAVPASASSGRGGTIGDFFCIAGVLPNMQFKNQPIFHVRPCHSLFF